MAVRRKIRWDRIAVAAVILIVLIFILGSCMQSCSDRRAQKDPATQADASADIAEQSQAEGGGAPVETAPPETAPASRTMANVPVILTDANAPMGGSSATTAAAAPAGEESSSEPAYVLPAGYQWEPVQINAMYSGNLILVNREHPSHLAADELNLEQVYYAEDRPETYEISYPGHTSLNSTALNKFNRLMKAYFAATNNKEIMFNYGYLEAGKEKSNPESATGLDVQIHLKKQDGSYDFVTNTAPYSWLFEHMARYGFVQRYPADKADITGEKGGYTALRYVGVPHAAYMAENSLCLEEYLDMLRGSHNFYNGTVLEYSTSELKYHIYYVPVDPDGELKIPVPAGGQYEVSGNNVDGFIVTAIVG